MERAQGHVIDVRNFSYHLSTYLFVNTLFAVLDWRGRTEGKAVLGLDWAHWLILFWGFGVAAHAIYAFFGDHKVDRIVEKEPTGQLVNRRQEPIGRSRERSVQLS